MPIVPRAQLRAQAVESQRSVYCTSRTAAVSPQANILQAALPIITSWSPVYQMETRALATLTDDLSRISSLNPLAKELANGASALLAPYNPGEINPLFDEPVIVETEFRSDIASPNYLMDSYSPLTRDQFPVLSRNDSAQMIYEIVQQPTDQAGRPRIEWSKDQRKLAVPLLEEGHVIGIVSFSLADGINIFPGNIEEFVSQLAEGAAPVLKKAARKTRITNIVIENEKLAQQNAALKDIKEELEKEVITDSLTGLRNRRYFDLYLREALARAKRLKREISLVIFDVDHFKECNDRHGHSFGDEVLREIGKLAPEALFRQGSDQVMRYGGEEFAIILPDTNHEGAIKVIERLRQMIAAHKFVNDDGAEVKVTISAGVETLDQQTDLDSLIRPDLTQTEIAALEAEAVANFNEQEREKLVGKDQEETVVKRAKAELAEIVVHEFRRRELGRVERKIFDRLGDKAGLKLTAEKLIDLVRSELIKERHLRVKQKVTASLGEELENISEQEVAKLIKLEVQNEIMAWLIKEADKKLYLAKDAGRNNSVSDIIF